MGSDNQAQHSKYANHLLFEFLIIAISFFLTAGCVTRNWAFYANHGSVQEAKRLIAEEEDLDAIDQHRDTPLFWAARNGHVDIVAIMIEKGVNLNETSQSMRETALIKAVKGNHVEVVNLLLSHHADKNIRDNIGYSALDWAAHQGNTEMLEILMERPSSGVVNLETGNPLVQAVYSGDLDIVKTLVKNGFPLDGHDLYGDTPFIAAVKAGDIQIASFLQEQGANIHGTDQLGRLPLMLASQGGYLDMFSFLMQEGADINLVSTHGYTLLMFATVNGHSEMVEYLLENGADPNQVDADQRSAMFLAAVQGQWHIIKIILEHGGQISPKTIAAEDKIPYLIGPMYEIGGEFYLETNNREKAMELLELAEQTFMGMSEEYSSRATGKAIQGYSKIIGESLLLAVGSFAQRHQGKIEARQHAQTSALSKSKSLGEYSQRLSATQPIYERQAQMAANQRSQELLNLYMYQNPDEDNLAISEAGFRALSDKASKRAEAIKLILQCIRETDGENIKSCKRPSSEQ